MATDIHSSKTYLPHQLFEGDTWHSRLLPSKHSFTYPYRYWGVNISALAAGDALPEVNTLLFSAKHKALQQFCAEDYLQENKTSQHNKQGIRTVKALEQRLAKAFETQTSSVPNEMLGLLICRNAGLYFSPVNFYIGFDSHQTPTHLLAEVSNTPWDKRHYYGFLLKGQVTEFCHDKNFHVSPFNPIDQYYRWQVNVHKQADNCLQVRIAINISDQRGEVLKTGVKMSGVAMTKAAIRQSLKQNPLMNITSLVRIYGHAFKLYALKKVPYINYDEKLADSKQKQE